MTLLFGIVSLSSLFSQEKNAFPDENFRNYVLRNFDLDKNGIISKKEALRVKNIVLINKCVKSLEGIQYFPNLESLVCNDNQLTTLDLSKNTALTNLQCDNNQLTTLNVSKNTALDFLTCSDNQLTTLDVSNNTALTNLTCSNNQLTTLDVRKNMALTGLICSNNQLTTLNVNTNLIHLSCYNNKLTSLDISHTKIGILSCNMSTLKTLYLKTGSRIYGINIERNTEKINPITEIEYKD